MNPKHHLITQKQAWLVTAAIGDEQTAKWAWNNWEKSIGSWSESIIDQGSFRLLPSVYRNLLEKNIETASLARLKGIYKKASINNMRLFHYIKQELQLLHNENIPIMIFKGGNLVLNYYQDRGARPMSDIDVLIPPDLALSALKILINNGWRAIHVSSPLENFEGRKSIDLIHPSGVMLDLHRSALLENSLSNDEHLWQKGRASSFDGLPILVPCVEDELLIACVHGWRWNPVPSIRWIIDSNMLLRGPNKRFDWSYFVEEARRRKVSYRVWKALCLLDEFKLIPLQDAINNIKHGPFESYEAIEEAKIRRPFGVFSPLVISEWYVYIREHGHPKGARSWVVLTKYLIKNRKAPSGWPIIFWIIDKIWNAFKRLLNRYVLSAKKY